MKIWITLFSLSSLGLLTSCGPGSNAGNTMETENSIAVRIVDAGGQPAARAQVSLRPLWYLSDTTGTVDTTREIRDLTTDNSGELQIDELPNGRYLLYATQNQLATALEFSIPRSLDEAGTSELALDTVGTLDGLVPLPEGVPFAWIQIYGLDARVRTDRNGRFRFPNLPAGSLQLIAWSPAAPTALGSQSVVVNSAETIDLGEVPPPILSDEDPSTWRHERSLAVRTLVSDWMRPLQSPTVLTLRLNGTAFPFDEALPDGRDFRIEDPSGRPVLFDRVRWSSSKKRAVIRLRLGNLADTGRSYTLRWGKTGAIDPGRRDVWPGISDSLQLALNSVLFDDFERNSSRTALPPPISPTWWFTRASEEASVTAPGDDDFVTALQPAGAGRSGQAARIQYESPNNSWVILGTALANGPYSMATLDSAVFWARGDGNCSFTLENNHREPWKKAWLHHPLDSVWTRIRVRPSDFLAPDSIGGNVGWEAVKDSISNLTLFAQAGSEIWIDDIRLYGINIDDLH